MTAPAPRWLSVEATEPSMKQVRSEGGRREKKEGKAATREAGGRERGAERVRERSREIKEKEIQGGRGR